MSDDSSSTSSESDSDQDGSFSRNLFSAVYKNDYTELKKLSKRGKPIKNYQDKNISNNTLLHVAIKRRKRKHSEDNTKIVKFLINSGLSWHVSNICGKTPYHIYEKRSKSDKSDVDWKPIEKIYSNSQKRKKQTSLGTNKKQKQDPQLDEDEQTYWYNTEYKSAGLKRSFHGVVYQFQLILMVMYRGVKAYSSISLGSEWNDAEKFDDISLKYQRHNNNKYYWRFIQIKHILQPQAHTIKKAELFRKRKTQDEMFNLHKYFMSFCKIKDNSYFINDHLEEFSICTNAYLDQNATMFFEEDNDFKEDKILFINDCKAKKYKLVAASKKDLAEVYESVENTKPDWKNAQIGRTLDEFVTKFRFIMKYPNRREMNEVIKSELGTEFCLRNPDLPVNTLKEYICKWFLVYKQSKDKAAVSNFLYIENGKDFLDLIRKQIHGLKISGLSMAYPAKLRTCLVNYEKVPKEYEDFISHKSQILIIFTSTHLLSVIKLEQFLREDLRNQFEDNIIFLKLKTFASDDLSGLVFDSFSSPNTHDLLIIDCEWKAPLKKKRLRKIADMCLKVLSTNITKKVIVIGDRGSKFIKLMISLRTDYKTYIDEITYSDFCYQSQFNILKKKIYFQDFRVSLSDILNRKSASNVLSNDILQQLINNKQIHIDQPRTSFSNPSTDDPYINRTLNIISENKTEVVLEEELVTWHETSIKQMIVVGGQPAYGKSLLLSNLHRHIKSKFPKMWIKRINLNEIANALKEIDSQSAKEATDFLIRNSNFNKNMQFQNNFLEEALLGKTEDYKYPKVILMLDGFDEVYPTNKANVLKLLLGLQSTNVCQVWVTTRLHYVDELANILKASVLLLNNLSTQDKINFLEAYTSSRGVTMSDDICNSLTARLAKLQISLDEYDVTEYERVLFNKTPAREILQKALRIKFSDAPLHLKMMIEVVLKYRDAVIADDINMAFIYKKFVELKFDKFYDEKVHLEAGNNFAYDLRKTHIKKILYFHAQLAFKVLFHDGIIDEGSKSLLNETLGIGFITVVDKVVAFVHRSFAEYFVIPYFERNIDSNEVQIIIKNYVLSNTNFSLTRDFVNSDETVVNSLVFGIRNCTSDIELTDIFFHPLEEKLLNLVQACFRILILDKGDECVGNTITNILNDPFDRINLQRYKKLVVILFLAQYDVRLYQCLFLTVMNAVMIKHGTVSSVIEMAFDFYSGTDITTILNILHEKQPNNPKIFLNRCILHILTMRGRFDYIQQLFIWMKRVSRSLQVKLLLELDSHGRSFLRVAKHGQGFDDCLKYLNENYHEEFEKLCQMPNSEGSVLHSFTNFMIYRRCVLQQPDTKALTIEDMQSLLRVFKTFSKNAINNIMFVIDNLQATALHYSDNNIFNVLMDFCLETLTSTDMKRLLLIRDISNKSSVYHHAVKYPETLRHLLSFIETNYTKSKIFEILLLPDIKGLNMLHSAAANNCSATITLLKFSLELGDTNYVKRLLYSEDLEGKTVLQFSHCSSILMTDLLKFASEVLSPNDLLEFANKTDLTGKNIFHYTAKVCDSFEALLELWTKYFGKPSLDEVLLNPDKDGNTCLHHVSSYDEITLSYCYPTEIDCLAVQIAEFVKHYVPLNVFIRFLLKRNLKGQTAFSQLNLKGSDHLQRKWSSIYEWLIFKLNSLHKQNNDKKCIQIYWDEFDSIYFYKDNDRAQNDMLFEIVNEISNRTDWTQINGTEQWILEL